MKYFLSIVSLLFFSVAACGQTIQPAGPTNICGAGSVLLSVIGASAGNTFQWQKDGAAIAGETGINYTATASGSYTVVITNPAPPKTLPAVAVSITPQPAVDFSFAPNAAACSNIPIQFTSTVTPGTAPYSYAWDFGDGLFSNAANPSHSFVSLGCGTVTFAVKLTVTDAKGCVSSTATHNVTVLQMPDVQVSDLVTPGTPFSNCANDPSEANPNYTISVGNNSPNEACISSYSIDWGDGQTTANVTFPLTHTYTQLGAFVMKVTGLGNNGCSNIKSYGVANQKNPDIGIGTFGLTEGCAPLPINIVLSLWATNSPGTTYLLDYGDGSSTPLTHPINPKLTNDTITHTYTTTSCPNEPVYNIKITATNACRTKSFVGGDIVVKIKPQSDFEIITSPSCINTPVCFKNITKTGFDVGCNVFGSSLWNFGDPASGAANTSTQGSPCHTYAAPGVYTVTLTTANVCGPSTISKTVCITAQPVPAFTLSSPTGCIPLTTTATNTTTNITNSCAPPTYSWSVTYAAAFCGTTQSWSFAPGSTATSASPSFIFSSPGIYTIQLEVSNACGKFQTTQVVNVKKPPTVTIAPPTYPCGTVIITPAATVTECGTATSTYVWAFAGGSPATSTSLNPGPVTFTTIGNHAITLAVTNECGTTTATSSVVVSAAPDVAAIANKLYCGGETTAAIAFTSTAGTPVYNWVNSNPAIGLAASGTGNIPAFTAANSGTTPITATITVSPFVSANCSGLPATFTITVNPRPAAPNVSTPIIYCLNATAVPLTATAAGGNTLTWYSNSALTGGTAIAPTPATTANGNTIYYVTQSNSFTCVSPYSTITVTVNGSINGNAIAANQNICANTIPAALTGTTVSGGSGTYSYQWLSSPNGLSWVNIPGANTATYAPPALTATLQYRRVVNSAPCSDTSNIVIITVQGALASYGIAASQTICAGLVPALLTGQLPTGGGGSNTYVWESSTDNINWAATAVTGQDYQPGAIAQTTYFRRKVFASQCNAVSNTVTITINPTPVAVITTAAAICEYDAAKVVFTATTGTAPFTVELTVTAPGGGTSVIPATINTNGPFTINNVIAAGSAAGSYSAAITKITDGNGCINTAAISPVSIIVNATPLLVLSAPATICNGTPTTLTVTGATTYQWAPATGLSSTTGGNVIASPTATTTYTVTGTQNNCTATASVIVMVTPGTTIASAGPAQILCGLAATALTGNNAVTGTGSWAQVFGPTAGITTASQNNTAVTGLQPGQRYIFQWVITGLPPCPATSANDTIDVLSPIINTIGNDTIICNGETVTLLTQALAGGSTTGLPASYTYQWQAAPQGTTNWQTINGQTQAALTVTPATSTCYRRLVKSNTACEATSNTICITVNPNIANNIIAASQEVCVDVLPNGLTGALPAGGDGNYIYTWQTSTDNTNWGTVGSAISYAPGMYTTAGIHYFRRNVFSGSCNAISNVAIITVRPNAKAIFTASKTVACTPFDLTKVITATALPDSNGLYTWYANDSLLGSNTTGTFPAYSINNSGDTVIIKLVTTSQYGCKADSIQQQFITVITAQARFTKNIGAGCGPLPVTFTNNSSLISGINFNWNFGNGITITAAQPGTIIFNPSPDNRDTTYQITLKAFNGCDTTTWRDSVKIRANPKARFGVDTTYGCSPFTVQVRNNSLGAPNTYYWNFGDGHLDTTYANGTLSYTYNSGPLVDTFSIQLIAVNECGSDTQVINVRVAPNDIKAAININSTDLFGCAPHNIVINNASTGATSFIWDFGDGTPNVVTSNQSSVPHSYTAPGTYIIQIDISNGCSDTTIYREVTVYTKPTAAFTTSKTIYCAGDTVRVSNTSLNATNCQWFWRDATGSTGLSPTHVYTAPGDYVIYLRAEKTNSSGVVCYDTIVKSITVLGKPIVSIQTNVRAINCAPFTFTATAPGIINETAAWYITDSTTTPSVSIINGTTAQYTFNKPGTFSVQFLANNIAGCADSTTIRFTVQGKPVAAFTPSDISICTRDTTVTYLNATSYNGNDALKYNWLVDNVPLSANGNFTHRYTVTPQATLPRAFNTWLIVSNTVGCSDTAKAVLQMNPSAKAQFSISNPNTCVPFIPAITNNSQFASIYKWIVNGVQASTDASPSLVINQAATLYTVTLIADNIYGCKPDTFTVTFTSRIKPNASFTVSDTLGCSGVLNAATSNTTTSANTYAWDWGDNTPGSGFTSPTHQYTGTGQYQITLVASDGVCRDTATQLVKVGEKPTADFAVNTTLTCDTARVQFINQTVNATSYVWSFGDGTFSTEINPPKSFAPSLTPYTVKLVADNFGCKDSVVKANLVTAKVPPASDFFISPTPVITIPNYTFSFNNLTLNSVNYQYLWSLGDGTSSTDKDIINHKYADTGNYPIRLIVLDNISNCADTTIKIARIDGFPGWMYIPNAICPNCMQENLRTFLPKGTGLKEYRLQIFTTWGELVFETTSLDSKGSPNQAWDAKYKGSIVQQDVYVWKIQAKFKNGSEWLGMIYPGETKYKKAGSITVVK